MKNNILYILDDYHIGGISSYVKEYSFIASKKNNTTILGTQGDLINQESFFGKSRVVTFKSEWFKNKLSPAQLFVYLYETFRFFSNNDFDIIHFSSPWSGLITVLILFVLRKKSKYITTFHGAVFLESSAANLIKNKISLFYVFNFLKEKINYLVQRELLFKSDKVVVLSMYSKKLLKNLFGYEKNVSIIPGFLGKKTKAGNDFKNLTKKDKIIFCNFGRFEDRKGIDLLLNAIKIVKNKTNKDFVLVMASPVYDQELIKIYRQFEKLELLHYVHILPSLNDGQKRMLLKVSDAFIIPSKRLETFGFTIIESLREGVPVIGTPVGAIVEILKKVDSKLISKKASANELAKTILFFVKLNSDYKKSLSQKSKGVFLTNYLADNFEDAITSLYTFKN